MITKTALENKIDKLTDIEKSKLSAYIDGMIMARVNTDYDRKIK